MTKLNLFNGILSASLLASCLGVSAGAKSQSTIAPPPPPTTSHHINPMWRIVETVYRCDGGERRFSVGYDRLGQIEFRGGTRAGTELSNAAVRGATDALRQLDAVSSIYPQCSPSSDLLTVTGRVGNRRAVLFLVWVQDRLQTSPPEFIQ